jgi:hypothetical protein
LVVRLTRPPTIRGSHKSLPRRVCVAVAPCSRRCDRLGALLRGFLVGVDPARHRAGTWSDLTRGGRSCWPPWSRLSGRHAGVDSRARGRVFRDLAADESDVWNAHERDPYCLDEHGQGGFVHCGHHPRHNSDSYGGRVLCGLHVLDKFRKAPSPRQCVDVCARCCIRSRRRGVHFGTIDDRHADAPQRHRPSVWSSSS